MSDPIVELNLGGAPPFYNDPNEMEKEIERYKEYIKGEFDEVDANDKEGNTYKKKIWIREPEPATITGLCLFLGFESRQSFYDYGKKPEFSYIINKARLFIEHRYECGLHAEKVVGSIFALKNMGWKDKQETEHSGTMGIVWNETKTYDNSE